MYLQGLSNKYLIYKTDNELKISIATKIEIDLINFTHSPSLLPPSPTSHVCFRMTCVFQRLLRVILKRGHIGSKAENKPKPMFL